MSALCACGHPGGPEGVHEYIDKEADPEFEPPECTVAGCGCTGFETPEDRKARKVAAFAAHGPRYARLAEELIGADDPVFAVAHLLVDVHARVDLLVDAVRSLEFQVGQKRGSTR